MNAANDPHLTQREGELLSTTAAGELVQRRVRVRVVAGPTAGAELTLERGSLFIGSGPQSELRVDDARVSRAHVEIALLAKGVRVKDLGSTNGTFLGDSRVEAIVVEPPVELRLGTRTRIELTAADVPAPPAPSPRARFGGLVGTSAAMRQVFGLLERVAPSAAPVVIEGERGTGKSTAAVALHECSQRAGGPLERIDLRQPLDPGELEERVARARGGSLLLEHVDEIPDWTTRELLPLLDAIERGAIDARVLATSTSDLRERVERGAWSRDLFFSLAVIRVTLPPLRERLEDLPVLIAALGQQLAGRDLQMTPADLAPLRAHHFPGNVRELRGAIEEVLILRPSEAGEGASDPAGVAAAADLEGVPFKDAKARVVDSFEREYVRRLLERHDGNVSRAAEEAGISRNHLTSLAQKHGLR
ncbi:MAG: sigma 54-interacting transcriptional regulator [Myxococcota bacterium]|nr:sigma 54-interacting transcriptional regulator [Myxococcota bacterium]